MLESQEKSFLAKASSPRSVFHQFSQNGTKYGNIQQKDLFLHMA